MLLSMTGYGKTEISLPDKKITIEIKSLNSKSLDANLKIPSLYREKELEIRKILQDKIKRGKVECSFFYELNEGVSPSQINQPVFENYYKQLDKIQKKLGIKDSDLVSAILKLPDAVKVDRMVIDEQEWKKIIKGIENSIQQLNEFRLQEGQSMEEDLRKRLKNILTYLHSIKPYEKQRIEKLRERIAKSIEDLKISSEVDSNRFEQEMIFYLEKLDISEEKVRLENHCRYFEETINKEAEAGKKLAFISQEMGREINTLGSKANDSDIQHIVVKMKNELEKIKELILNIL